MNFNSFQRFVARILLVSLCLQSCGVGFDNKPLIPIEKEPTTSIQTNTQAIIPSVDIEPLIDQELTAQGGHLVTCYEEDGELKADIEMNVPQGFSKTYEGLNVYVEQGTELTTLSRLDKKTQECRIHLQLTQDNQPAKVVIHKSAGLMGGGDTKRITNNTKKRMSPSEKKEKKKKKKKKEKSSSSSEEDEGSILSADSGESEVREAGEEKNEHYFPRCEYYTRYIGTSHFAMSNYEHWGTYFRSTPFGGEVGRSTKENIIAKTFKNPSLNIEEGDSYNSRTGTFHNPYKDKDYKQAVENAKEYSAIGRGLLVGESIKKSDRSVLLYEEILDYRNQICSQILELLHSNKTEGEQNKPLEIIHHNEYPCLLVKLPLIEELKKQKIGKQEIEGWNKLFIAYYLAIVNKEAQKAGIPIEMVIRSSFGHLLPSIDVAGESFRINVGIVPTCYGDILAQGLGKLQDIIDKKLNITLEQYQYNKFIDKINNRLRKYNNGKPKNKTLPEWNKKQKCYEILGLKGDPSGRSITLQITRKRVYSDLLADYVAEELDKDTPDYTLPIVKMLDRLTFNESVSMKIGQSDFRSNSRKWEREENIEIKKDNQFWKVISQALECIEGDTELCNNKILSGLYSKLEKANKEFIIRSANTIDAKDDLGSDSEYEATFLEEQIDALSEKELEAEDKKEKIYARKVTVTTGMMAINLANYLARYYLKACLGKAVYRTAHENMYYETGKLLNLSSKNEKKLAVRNNRKRNNISTILFFDLNHCDTLGSGRTRLRYYMEGSLFEKDIPIIVMDCTSSTPSLIKGAIKDAVEYGVELILLVSSGLKNEQFGADNNPYGTVRIITLDKKERDKLYKEAQTILKKNGSIPATAHKIRKGYKQGGFTLTNQQILEADLISYSSKDDRKSVARSVKNLREITKHKETFQEYLKLKDHLTSKVTVIESIEDRLRNELIEELQSFTEARIEEEYEKEKRRYDDECKVYEEFAMMKQQQEEGDSAGEMPTESSSPKYVSIEEIELKYGNLDNLANLIKVSKIEDDELSQILYDCFESDEMMEDIINALELEHTTLNINPALVRLILEGCDVYFYDVNVIQKGFLVRYLKEAIEQRFKEIVNAYQTDRNELEQTPLHIAIGQNQKSKVIKLLSKTETDINAKDISDDTPLHLAVELGNLKMVKLLLEKKARVDLKNDSGETPLHKAAYSSNLNVIKLLLKYGSDIKAKTENGSSPLHTAAKQNQFETACYLISKGADVNAKDDEDWTPLHVAANNGYHEIIRILLKEGADANFKDKDDNTPLHTAISALLCFEGSGRYSKFLKTCKLLQGKTNLETKNKDKFTPLQLAKNKNLDAIIKLLTNENFYHPV